MIWANGSIKEPRYNDLPDIFFLLLDVPDKAATFSSFQLLQDHLLDSMLDINGRYFLFHDFYLFLYFLLFLLFLNVFALLIRLHVFFSYFYIFYLCLLRNMILFGGISFLDKIDCVEWLGQLTAVLILQFQLGDLLGVFL